jgi:hypothetical protein
MGEGRVRALLFSASVVPYRKMFRKSGPHPGPLPEDRERENW